MRGAAILAAAALVLVGACSSDTEVVGDPRPDAVDFGVDTELRLPAGPVEPGALGTVSVRNDSTAPISFVTSHAGSMRAVRVVDSKIATCLPGSSLEPVVDLAPGESVELAVELHMIDCATGPGTELLTAGRYDVAVMVDIDPPSLGEPVEIDWQP